MKTNKEQAYHQRRCSYCEGTGVDTFNINKPCPNCSNEPVLMTDYEKKEIIDDKIRFEFNNQ